jgi:hypothetical protein
MAVNAEDFDSHHACHPLRFPQLAAIVLINASLLAGGCGTATDLDKQTTAIESIRSTTVAVADAWLDGKVSTPYARASLERAYELAEDCRSSLTKSPSLAADPRRAALIDQCERLARQIALLTAATASGDRDGIARLRRQGSARASS